MNNTKPEDCLHNMSHVPINVRENKVQETIQICIKEMHRQSCECEERTGFWEYLSDILRFEGLSIFGLQIAVLLVICFGISTIAQFSETLPAFMPLFGLALVPVLYRNQAYGMCEMEAATRASGAQIVLAKLILAGAANLLCMTTVVCLQIYITEASDQIIQVILYVIVPFLISVVGMLRRIRVCKHGNMTMGAAVSLVSCAAWGASARIFPWLYETSATGIWVIAFTIFTVFFIREICFIIQMRREGKMYGTIN